jgi:uncharacterized membrane protein
MKQIKTYIFQHFEVVFTLFFATLSCIFLLAIRLKLTHSFFLLFLVWNLFLAAIPYFISSYLVLKVNLNGFVHSGLAVLWLLFLPNAPYIITDIIHVTHAEASYKLFDAIIISLFAGSGLLFYVISLKQMVTMYALKWKRWKVMLFQWAIPFLCAFGIYLGRFLRWNSWDILQNPVGLLTDIIAPLLAPSAHPVAWLTTLSFGFGLYGLFWISRKFQQKKAFTFHKI